jgi:CBS domain-containing protein
MGKRPTERDQTSWATYAWAPPLGAPGIPPFEDVRPGQEVGGRAGGGHGASSQRRFWEREPVTAGDLMTSPVRAATPDATLAEVAEVMRSEDVGIVPVIDASERLVGVITDRDIVVRVIPERDPAMVRVSEVMTANVETARREERIDDLIARMTRRLVQRIPVVDDAGRLVGIVALQDVARRAERDHDIQGAFGRLAARRSFWTNL